MRGYSSSIIVATNPVIGNLSSRHCFRSSSFGQALGNACHAVFFVAMLRDYALVVRRSSDRTWYPQFTMSLTRFCPVPVLSLTPLIFCGYPQ